MPRVGIGELKNRASWILRQVREDRAEYVITHHGRPVAVLLPANEEDLEDYVLAHHPHFVESREQAREAIRRGEYIGSEALRAGFEGQTRQPTDQRGLGEIPDSQSDS